jgi:hypothetical protein
MEQYHYEADTQMGRVVHYRGDTDEVVGTLNLRMYFPKELDAILQYNGMRVLEKFGDWDRTPFGPESNNQILSVRRRVEYGVVKKRGSHNLVGSQFVYYQQKEERIQYG